jgi:hypothetical protein
MASPNVHTGGLVTMSRTKEFSMMQRMALRAAHPVSIIFYFVGAMWSIFYLWNQNWVFALAIFVAARALGFAAVRHTHLQEMSETLLGKMALLHLHPANLAVQFIGAIVCLAGVWMHTTETILGGASLIAAGHAFGWSKVNSSLDLTTEEKL